MSSFSAAERTRQLSNGPLIVAARLATEQREGWRTAPIGTVSLSISTGTTPPSQESRYYGGTIDWYTPSDIGGVRWLQTATKTVTDEAIEEKKARVFKSNTLLITCIGNIGRIGLVDKPSSSNQQITGVRFYDDIDPEFAYYSLFSRRDALEAAAPASTLPILNQARLSTIEISFPSLNEQKQISRFLAWYEDRLLRNDLSRLENHPPLPAYLSSVIQTLVTVEELASKIEEARGLRREAGEEVKALIPAILAQGYDEAAGIAGGTERLDNLCHTITDGTHVTPRYIDEGVPFLSVKDITTGVIRFDNVKYISPEEHANLTKRCKPERDDVLLTKVGTTGFAKAINVDHEFSIFVSLALLKLDKTRLDPKYTEYMLNSSRLREFSAAGTRGVGNKNLVLKFIKEFPMPAPPLSEQLRIVAFLDSLLAKIGTLKVFQKETAGELDALLPAVLDRAFKRDL